MSAMRGPKRTRFIESSTGLHHIPLRLLFVLWSVLCWTKNIAPLQCPSSGTSMKTACALPRSRIEGIERDCSCCFCARRSQLSLCCAQPG